MPETDETNSSRSGHDTPPARSLRVFNIMPRPEQPGTPHFDGMNVTEFLRRWNIECEDAGLTKSQKCDRFPYYCTDDVQSVVELLDGYLERNWDKLEEDLKEQYWQNDTQKNTPAALNQLIREANTLDLSVYVLKYTSITKALVDNNEMSVMQRCRRFLDGLSEQLRDKAFDFCTTNDWKLSSHDTGAKDPNFDKLRKFILDKALSAKKKVVYIKERATEGYDDLKESAASVVSTPPASVTTPASTPASDPAIVELTKQIASLTLTMQANMNPPKPVQSPVNQTRPARSYDPRCIWCDSTEHVRRIDCPEFKEAMKRGLVTINAENRITNAKSGDEIPPMFKKGGMKKFFEMSNSPAIATTSNITLEEPANGTLGPSERICITTLDFDNDTRTDEIFDVEINEK